MENIERFEEWMRRIGNIYLSDDEQMCNAYNKIEKEEQKESHEFIEKRVKDIEVEFEQIN